MEISANLDDADKWRERLVATAIGNLDIQTVRDNIEYVDVNTKLILGDKRFMFLHLAAGVGSAEICRLLIKAGANVNSLDAPDFSALHKAVISGHYDIVSLLIQNGANVNFCSNDINGLTALITAAMLGSAEICSLLIEHGANVNSSLHATGHSALHIAVWHGHYYVVSELIKGGCSIDLPCTGSDTRDISALIIASMVGYYEIVSLLLRNGANINFRDNKGITVLMHAISMIDLKHSDSASSSVGANVYLSGKHSEIVSLLIRSGANVNLTGEDGRSALHRAVQKGNNTAVEELLKNEAVVNIKMKDGSTPLHIAAVGGNVTLVSELLGFKADIDAQDFYGKTALHVAAGLGDVEIVKILINSGASKFFDRNGSSVLDYAILFESIEVFKSAA